MSEAKTYTGGCHCGAVRYQVSADLSQPIVCNCSHCYKLGWMLSFVPEENFTLLSGEDNLTDYQFNKKVIHHLFCKTCGIKSFGRGTGADGQATIALNLRCLDDLDVTTLSPMAYDGKSV